MVDALPIADTNSWSGMKYPRFTILRNGKNGMVCQYRQCQNACLRKYSGWHLWAAQYSDSKVSGETGMDGSSVERMADNCKP